MYCIKVNTSIMMASALFALTHGRMHAEKREDHQWSSCIVQLSINREFMQYNLFILVDMAASGPWVL